MYQPSSFLGVSDRDLHENDKGTLVWGDPWRSQLLESDGCLVVHLHRASSILTTDVNTHRCPEKCRLFGFVEGERESERHQFCVSPPLPSVTSMNLLRITIFKRQPSFPPSDKAVIILHLHDKCVCLCTHLCMYV